jgi:hypothetical protein
VKVASLESLHRKQQLELVHSGCHAGGLSLASVSQPPLSHTPRLGAQPNKSWEADDQDQVKRELFADVAAGEENDSSVALTPTLAGA